MINGIKVVYFFMKNAAFVGNSRFPNKLGQALQDLLKISSLGTYMGFSNHMDIVLVFK